MQTIREWAKTQGYEVGQRGRIHHDIVMEYEKTFGAGAAKVAKPKVSNSRKDIDEVRRWARDNGYTVSERGRIAARVKKAYDKAQKAEVDPVVQALAEELINARAKASAVVLRDKFGRTYRTQFCSHPLDNPHHGICPKVVMNATLVGEIRKNVICDCTCHKEAA